MQLETGNEDAAQARSLLGLMNKGLRIAEPSISSAVGAAVGLLGGPPGAVLGGLAGGVFSTAIKKLGSEMDKRFMGPREEARVGAVFVLGASEIVQRVQSGERIRSDGFFDEGERLRSDAEEVWESLLAKCQREASERKLPYMSHLFASLAFEDRIGLDMAHQLISTAERLSYRQLCIVRLCVNSESYDLRSQSYRGDDKRGGRSVRVGWPTVEILYECLDLYQRELIHTGDNAALGLTQIVPSAMRAHGLGLYLYDLMRLSLVPKVDIDMIAEQLRR